RDVDEARIVRQRLHLQPRFVHGDSGDARAARLEKLANRRIAGLLDCDARPRLDQQPGHEIERALGAARDHDVLRIRGHATTDTHVARDGGAQPRLSGCVPVARAEQRASDLAGDQATPCVEWKEGRIRYTDTEVVARRSRPGWG